MSARMYRKIAHGKEVFHGKLGGANKGLGEAQKSCTRKEHESATNSIAKRGQGAIAPCRVKGQRPLWGLGQRPNCSASDQHLKRTQQRRRQRSVPASNFARPQMRPQAALPQDSVKNQNFASAVTDAFWQMCLRWFGKSWLMLQLNADDGHPQSKIPPLLWGFI